MVLIKRQIYPDGTCCLHIGWGRERDESFGNLSNEPRFISELYRGNIKPNIIISSSKYKLPVNEIMSRKPSN